ncbi:hypothetical protein Tco_0625487 [Tanacetum coccineum]|uniref:Uncharacterized protein n=1 Tax=Tanacetum coccineum TaxID=301880 RepID=A0ABQ4WGW7_9ASTR
MFPRRSEGEELKYPFFESDGSSSDEWRYYGMGGDDYEGPPIFDDDQFDEDYEGPPVFDDYPYEEEIVSGDVGKGFVDNYPKFQEDENNVSFSGVVLRVEEESMSVYDTDIEDVTEEEEGFVGKGELVGENDASQVGKGEFGGEEENIEDVVVVVNDHFSSMIQTTDGSDSNTFEKKAACSSQNSSKFGELLQEQVDMKKQLALP